MLFHKVISFLDIILVNDNRNESRGIPSRLHEIWKQNEGKSGSARVCYVDFVVQEVIYLITVYSKNEKENLSQAERNSIKGLIEQLKLKL